MYSNAGPGPLVLLHLDDSADDRLLVEQAISLTQTPLLYFGADCIEEATRYFEPCKPGAAIEYPLPRLILLDYDLGMQTGLDFLYWLRVMKEIKSIPVVMFSGSPGKDHVAKCYATGGDYYIAKPSGLGRLMNIIRTLHLSLLPHRGPCPVLLLHEYQPKPAETYKG